jgi:hypothetical protein
VGTPEDACLSTLAFEDEQEGRGRKIHERTGTLTKSFRGVGDRSPEIDGEVVADPASPTRCSRR